MAAARTLRLSGTVVNAVKCRHAWTQAARDQQVLVERADQKAAGMAEKVLAMLRRHEASMDAAFVDLQQQVACWVASLSQIQAAQSAALVCSLLRLVAHLPCVYNVADGFICTTAQPGALDGR